jgi:hypothetical protein
VPSLPVLRTAQAAMFRQGVRRKMAAMALRVLRCRALQVHSGPRPGRHAAEVWAGACRALPPRCGPCPGWAVVLLKGAERFGEAGLCFPWVSLERTGS